MIEPDLAAEGKHDKTFASAQHLGTATWHRTALAIGCHTREQADAVSRPILTMLLELNDMRTDQQVTQHECLVYRRSGSTDRVLVQGQNAVDKSDFGIVRADF